jgi:hypothetical protein
MLADPIDAGLSDDARLDAWTAYDLLRSVAAIAVAPAASNAPRPKPKAAEGSSMTGELSSRRAATRGRAQGRRTPPK